MTKAFNPTGLLAVDPRAIGRHFDAPQTASNLIDGVAVEFVRGPLYHHLTIEGDSYDAIVGRVTASLAGEARAVVLVVDSPGGYVSGLFDACRALVSAQAGLSKPIVAFVDGQACSAAYALAASCSRLYVSDTASLGSIGVIEVLVDFTANDKQEGFRYEVVTSGARKADGHPHVAISAETLAVARANVDHLASKFFAFVEERRSIPAKFVKGLEAGQFTGELAVQRGLADRVAMLDDVVAATIAGKDLSGVPTQADRLAQIAALQARAAAPTAKQLQARRDRVQRAEWDRQTAAHQERMRTDPQYRQHILGLFAAR